MRERVQFWLGMALSGIFLYLAVRNIPLSDLAASLTNVDLVWLVAGIVFQVIALIPRAVRWLIILEPEGSLKEAFYSQNIGYLFNNIFPLRVGELARVIVMSKGCGIPIVRVATSVILERMLDVITVLIGLLLVLSRMTIPDQFSLLTRSFVWLVFLTLILFILFVRYRHPVDRFFRRLILRFPSRFRGRILDLWKQVINGIRQFSSAKYTLRLSAWFLISWLFSVALYWCTMRAFVFNPTLLEAVFSVSVLALSFTIPSSPGYLGVFQFVGQQALVIPFGSKYSPVTALAIALTVHMIFYGTTSLLGIIGVGRFGTSVANLRTEISDKPMGSEGHKPIGVKDD